MKLLQPLDEYFYARKLTWFEIISLLLIGLSSFIYKLDEVEFHVDENPWIYESTALNSFLKGDFSPKLWDEKYNGLLDPPMAKYLIYTGIYSGGLSITSLPCWNWHMDYQTNVERGCIPSREILWWARIPMAIASVFGILFASILVSKAHSRLAALCFYFFCLTTFTHPLRQAMSEAPLIFFTFLSGIVCYQGIVALARKKQKLALVRFSIFGILAGLAVASKLNAITILPAGVFSIGFVLFWKRRERVKEAVRLTIRFALLQIYIMIATFILINPYLYFSTAQNILLMFIARTFTLQVQMKMYPDSVVMADNWFHIVPRRIFEQLATPSYPGHYVINLILFFLGVYIMFQTLFNTKFGWEASLLLCSFSLALAVPGALTPLDWERYYLFPVLFSRMFIAVGFTKVLSLVFQKAPKLFRGAFENKVANF